MVNRCSIEEFIEQAKGKFKIKSRQQHFYLQRYDKTWEENMYVDSIYMIEDKDKLFLCMMDSDKQDQEKVFSCYCFLKLNLSKVKMKYE